MLFIRLTFKINTDVVLGQGFLHPLPEPPKQCPPSFQIYSEGILFVLNIPVPVSLNIPGPCARGCFEILRNAFFKNLVCIKTWIKNFGSILKFNYTCIKPRFG